MECETCGDEISFCGCCAHAVCPQHQIAEAEEDLEFTEKAFFLSGDPRDAEWVRNIRDSLEKLRNIYHTNCIR